MYVSIFRITKEIPEDDLVWVETCRTKVLTALLKSVYLTIVNKVHLNLEYSVINTPKLRLFSLVLIIIQPTSVTSVW
jgi:hypothetical protein